MNRGVVALTTLVIAALLSLPAAVAATASADTPQAQFGPTSEPAPGQSRLLPRAMQGKQALRALRAAKASRGLAVAADRNRMPLARLTRLLTEDSTVWMDARARVFYADTPTPEQATSSQSGPPPSAFSGDPLALNSRPGASRIIHLDFDGADVVDTAWNDPGQATSLPNGHYAGYSLDGDPAFNDQEAAVIAETWQRVAQLYAPFDVNVTTAAPAGETDYSRDSPSDTTYGAHVIFTADQTVTAAICDGGCAGIAYLDVFGQQYGAAYSIAWAFTSGIDTNPDILAHVAAHEVGHQLSLEHDGDSNGDYYWGHDDWSPVMGGAAGRPLVQFSKGEYPGANNTEDDFARMAATNLPLLADGEGDDLATARYLGARPSYAQAGLISDSSDVDFFRIDRSCTEPITAEVTWTGAGSPLDLQLQLLDSRGDVLATDDPPSYGVGGVMAGMEAAVSTGDLDAGTYFVRIDGVGRGTTTDGYTDYGSVGGYRLTASGCATAAVITPPDAPGPIQIQVGTDSGTITWTPPVDPGSSPLTGYRVDVNGTTSLLDAQTRSMAVGGWRGGTSYSVSVIALSDAGASAPATASFITPTWAPTTSATIASSVSSSGVATLHWTAPPNPGGATLSGWRWQLASSDRGFESGEWVSRETLEIKRQLRESAAYTFTVTPVFSPEPEIGSALPVSRSLRWVPPATRPSAPRIAKAASGARHGRVTARARWTSPASNGGAALSGYRIRASRLNSHNHVVRRYWSTWRSASSRSYSMRLPRGRYRFQVVARNRVGTGSLSRYSNIVIAR